MKSLTMKKVTLLGVGAALCLATAASFGAMSISKASATSVTGNSGNATVSYTLESSWTIEIPETITVNSPVQITASANTVNGLTITVESENEFKLTNSKGASIDYELKVANSSEELGAASKLEQNGTVLTVTAGSEQSANTYIGAYVDGSPVTGSEAATDTLTFTITED